MKEILLTQGYIAYVDDEDFNRVNNLKWSANKVHHLVYAWHFFRDKTLAKAVSMHRFILGDNSNLLIDHIDGNPLNNQKNNLRFATASQNMANRRNNHNSAIPYKGVSKTNSKKNPFGAIICINKKLQRLGCFATAELAARAYDKKAVEVWGAYAKTNFPI